MSPSNKRYLAEGMTFVENIPVTATAGGIYEN